MKHMETKIVIGLGCVLGLGLAYYAYKYIICGTDGTDDSGGTDVDYVDVVDYEMLFSWLKSEYNAHKDIISSGCKFGIMPSKLSKQAFDEESGQKLNLQSDSDILGVFIIDEKEEKMITRKYYVYKEMAQSLKDLLPNDKVYIQSLKK